MTLTTPTPIEIPPAPPRPLWAVLFGTLYKPRNTFAYLRETATWFWLAPLMLVLLLTLVSRFIAVPIERAQAEAAMAAFQEQFQGQGGESGSVTFAGPAGAPLGGNVAAGAPGNDWLLSYGLPLVSVLVDWGVRGLLLFGLAWVLGGRPNLGAMFRVVSFTFLPNAVKLIVTIAIMLMAGRIPVSGLANIGTAPGGVSFNVAPSDIPTADDAPPPAEGQMIMIGPGGALAGPNFLDLLQLNFLAGLDIYWVWALGLMVIGVAVVAQFNWLKATLSTVLYWGFSLSLATIPTLLMPFIMSAMLGAPMLGP